MTLDYWVGGLLAVLLSCYVGYALIRPERF